MTPPAVHEANRTGFCPVCGGEPRGLAFPYQASWNGKTFDYRACGGCGSTFVDPLPTEDELKAIYSWENYHARHYPGVDTAKYQRTLGLLRRECPRVRTLLDFGCGGGGFLVAAGVAGYDCRGVEYEASAIEMAARVAGAPVTDLGTLLDSGRTFDLVRLSDVHPHLPDPASTFRTLERLLAPGGAFLVEGPLENNASLVYFLSAAAKWLRRRVGRDRPSSLAPTMLVRVNRDVQRGFFRDRLGYREHYFEVFETGWPFHVAGRTRPSFKERLKQVIGSAAVAVSRVQRGPVRLLGNRFVGVYRPEEGVVT